MPRHSTASLALAAQLLCTCVAGENPECIDEACVEQSLGAGVQDLMVMQMKAGLAGLHGPPKGAPESPPAGRFEQLSQKPTQPGRASASPTFCVFSRLIEQELPYIKGFLEYYQSIGVQAFYLTCNYKEQHDAIADYLSRLKMPLDIFFFTFDELGHCDDLLQKKPGFWDRIKEDFMIGVDSDEYWLMPQGVASLPELYEKKPADLYTMQWALVVNDKIDTWVQPPYKGYAGHAHKWMARTSMLDHVGVHSAALKDEFNPYDKHTQEKSVGTLIHFWGRGFVDPLMKSVTQYGTVKNYTTSHSEGRGALKGVLDQLNQKILPERMRLMAFYNNLPKNLSFQVERAMLDIDKKLENSFAAKVLGSEAAATSFISVENNLYKNFKSRLLRVMQSEDYPHVPPAEDREVSGWLWEIHERFVAEDQNK